MIKNWNSVTEIIDYAIAREQDAVEFYRKLSGEAKNSGMAEVFRGFALEEESHREKLEAVKRDGVIKVPKEKVRDMKLAEYLVDVDESADLDYQGALILAMKQEKAAFKLYSDLAAACDNEKAAKVLESLAQEEAKHKLRFEREYDDAIMQDN
jgi:rubrerythrin